MRTPLYLAVTSVLMFASIPTQTARASTQKAEKDPLRLIMSAQSVRELNELTKFDAEMESAKRVCDIELEENRIPHSCFEVLEKELTIHLISRSEYEKERLYLDQLCSQRAQLISLEESAVLHQRRHRFSPGCRSAIEERAQDLRYRAEVENPRQVFELRKSPVRFLK